MNKEISPAAVVAIVVVVVGLLGFVGWKLMVPQKYTGPPINMAEKMKGGGAGKTGGAPAAGPIRMGPGGMQSGGPGR
jgi:hypothetical protein